MKLAAVRLAAAVGLAAACAAPALAETQLVSFDRLVASATVAPPLGAGDTLFVDTIVTQETGALNQAVTFTVAPGAGLLEGFAAWEVTSAASAGPRLVGVNIDIFDAVNNLVVSDSFAGLLAGFAHSTLLASIAPGTYTLIATGTGVRDSSLDISLTFAVPEPGTVAMLLAGLGLLGAVARRRMPR